MKFEIVFLGEFAGYRFSIFGGKTIKKEGRNRAAPSIICARGRRFGAFPEIKSEIEAGSSNTHYFCALAWKIFKPSSA
ncbi:MAG: hypothetical protein JNN04_04030 [Cyclobacteriaceae bacterium]|nr:hypothetical protein [Cyclobacteriaceae bacterium]